MRTLLSSVFAVAALAGCAAVQEPYDYGYSPYYGDAYYYDTAPAYFAFGYNRYDYDRYGYNRYDYSPGYRGGVVVNRPVVQGSVQQRFSERRLSTRNRTVASATRRTGSSHTYSRTALRSDREARANVKRERSRVATTRSVDHGS